MNLIMIERLPLLVAKLSSKSGFNVDPKMKTEDRPVTISAKEYIAKLINVAFSNLSFDRLSSSTYAGNTMN